MSAGALFGGGIDGGVTGVNIAWYPRVIGGGTITKIGLHVAIQSGNICVGVFSPSGSGRSAVPGARKGTSGSVACPAVGYQEVSLGGSVVVAPGDFFYLGADNTSCSFRQARTSAGTASSLYTGINYNTSPGEFPAALTAGPVAAAADRLFCLIGVA
jgi:hypothetical protein